MSTIEEVKAAEGRMKKAQDALRAYVDRPAGERDVKLHGRLAAELKSATDDYLAAVLGLNTK